MGYNIVLAGNPNFLLNGTRGTFTTTGNAITIRPIHMHRNYFGLTTGSEWLDRDAARATEIAEFAAVNGRQPSPREFGGIDTKLGERFAPVTARFAFYANNLLNKSFTGGVNWLFVRVAQ